MLSLSCLALSTLCATALPPGFQKTLLFTGLAEPVAIDFLPDGRPIIAERQGNVVIISPGAPKSVVVHISDLTFQEEWGLLGMALDPNFAQNGYLYCFYTTASNFTCRVSRFTVVNEVANPASELIIWQNPQDCAGLSHHGGCIRFGPDGKLYIAAGEEMQASWAQNMASQRGKMLRLNPDGTVPADNPYIGIAGVDPLIWASGLRNPFRFTFDPADGRMFIGDVGFDKWEEVSIGRPTANYGWPSMEGPECFVVDCSDFDAPVWAYAHGDPDLTPNGESAVILGPVYRASQFPPEYQGNLFVGDHIVGWIRRLAIGAGGQILTNEEFDRSPEMFTVVDMKVGPDGSLYYTSIFDGQPGGQMLWKITYVGANQPPVAIARAIGVAAPKPPLFSKFNSTGSYDPDAGPGPLTFTWDFGDGTPPASGPSTLHAYSRWGRFYAKVTASDGVLQTTSAPIEITVGNPPIPAISSPPQDLFYRAGDLIICSGSAFDADDGQIPPASLFWNADIVHNTHTHPFASFAGATGQFTIPDSGHAPDHVVFRVRLTATDSDGIPTSVERTIRPIVSPLTFASTPPGIAVFVDQNPVATPSTYESVVNFKHTIAARLSASLNDEPYHFVGWQDGRPLAFDLTAPDGGITLTAQYEPGCGADVNLDAFVDAIDYDVFIAAFLSSDAVADLNRDAFVDAIDYDLFISAFLTGC